MSSGRCMDHIEFDRLKRYCTSPEQLTRLENVFRTGSMRKAAQMENICKNAVFQTITVLRQRAARMGDTPDEDAKGFAPIGYTVSGKSTMYDEDGKIKLQWVKTQYDPATHDRLLEAFEEASGRIKGLAKAKRPPVRVDSELLAIYPYGDPHIGMYAWHGDAEEDYDLNRAVELLTNATQRLIDSAPPAKNALIAFLGDFYHADNQSNRTAKAGNQLDVDSRWLKVFRVGVTTAVTLITMALLKHETVHVIVEIGNHDDHTALALAVCLGMYFKDEPRVTIDQSGQRFHYYRFGANFIGIHHGDLVKPAALPGIMASDRAADWGESSHRVWYTGHIHNQTRYDLAGCEVESFRVLPPRDAWAQSMGFRSGRSMDCIIRHIKHGEIARQTVHASDVA